MSVIKTKIDRSSSDFDKNREANVALAADLRALNEKLLRGGSARAREKHLARGKLLPRERITVLIDKDSDFLELGRLAAHEVYDDDVPAAGIITGIGRIQGTDCMIVANDATVKGGTYYPITVKKHLRAQEVALGDTGLLEFCSGLGGPALTDCEGIFSGVEFSGEQWEVGSRLG
ncbi:MAG: methylcrotonoyl-CoA carboxylase, partial [Gammaproteobacteria bacterium]|nr:methylcrotonoyl-CoA carboxylase [Gammaproteobacteria bacterium]